MNKEKSELQVGQAAPNPHTQGRFMDRLSGQQGTGWEGGLLHLYCRWPWLPQAVGGAALWSTRGHTGGTWNQPARGSGPWILWRLHCFRQGTSSRECSCHTWLDGPRSDFSSLTHLLHEAQLPNVTGLACKAPAAIGSEASPQMLRTGFPHQTLKDLLGPN